MICKGYEKLLLPHLKCQPEHSLVRCPKSIEDIDDFMQHVIRPNHKADIVILDQNIDVHLEVDFV
jgi:hypothetical protein